MNMLNPVIDSVTAFAPATCANVAVGFDILGFAIDAFGDKVTLTKRDDANIIISSVEPQSNLPLDIDKNTASVVIKKLCEKFHCAHGFSLAIQKGIPVSSGLGGSASSAVAAAVAFNAFLKTPLSRAELVQAALWGEEIASGERHADNVAPCVYGGLTLVRSLDALEIHSLPIPPIFCVLVHPHLEIKTKEARQLLKAQINLNEYVKQSTQLANFMVALYEKNISLLRNALTDYIIEPQRAQLVPAFAELKKIALTNDALGMSFSGSGPALFAWAESKEQAGVIGAAMCERLKQEKITADFWVTPISARGARVL